MDMKFVLFFIAISVAICCTNADTPTLNLVASITRVTSQIEKIKNPNWAKFPELLIDFLQKLVRCLTPNKVFKVDDQQHMPLLVKESIESLTPAFIGQQLISKINSFNWEELGRKVQSTHADDGLEAALKEFMQSGNFTKIHEQVWTDPEFLDVIGYFFEGGYTQIYTAIKNFYELMGRTDLNIPTAPPSPDQNFVRRHRSMPPSSNGGFPVQLTSPIFIQACDAMGLAELAQALAALMEQTYHEALKAILFGVEEVAGNPAIHVLLIKIGEREKGAFFHETLEMPEMQAALPLLQRMVLNGRAIGKLNTILEGLTGFTLYNEKLFQYMVNLIQYLVWNYPFPSN